VFAAPGQGPPHELAALLALVSGLLPVALQLSHGWAQLLNPASKRFVRAWLMHSTTNRSHCRPRNRQWGAHATELYTLTGAIRALWSLMKLTPHPHLHKALLKKSTAVAGQKVALQPAAQVRKLTKNQ